LFTSPYSRGFYLLEIQFMIVKMILDKNNK
jgi:hypothetical protein